MDVGFTNGPFPRHRASFEQSRQCTRSAPAVHSAPSPRVFHCASPVPLSASRDSIGCPRIALAALHVLSSQVADAVTGSTGARIPKPRLNGIASACGAVARPLVDFALARPADAEVNLRVVSSLLRQNDDSFFRFRSFARAPPAAAVAGEDFRGLQPPWGAH